MLVSVGVVQDWEYRAGSVFIPFLWQVQADKLHDCKGARL